jgi:hypothetical protein
MYLYICINNKCVSGNQAEVAEKSVLISSSIFFLLLVYIKVCKKEFFLDAMYEKVYGTVNL